jgi:hypothetical protein
MNLVHETDPLQVADFTRFASTVFAIKAHLYGRPAAFPLLFPS